MLSNVTDKQNKEDFNKKLSFFYYAPNIAK